MNDILMLCIGMTVFAALSVQANLIFYFNRRDLLDEIAELRSKDNA